MKTIIVCKCGSSRVYQDAAVNVNTGEISAYDDIRCGECGYDGRHFKEVEVEDDFDVVNDFYEFVKEIKP